MQLNRKEQTLLNALSTAKYFQNGLSKYCCCDEPKNRNVRYGVTGLHSQSRPEVRARTLSAQRVDYKNVLRKGFRQKHRPYTGLPSSWTEKQAR